GIKGLWNLYVYYELKKLPWPYNFRPKAPQGMKADSANYSINDVAPPLKTLQEGAEIFGYQPEHIKRLSEASVQEGILRIYRARNPASLQHDDNPNFMTKPYEVFSAGDGTWTLDAANSQSGETAKKTAELKWKTAPKGTPGEVADSAGHPVKREGTVFAEGRANGSPIRVDNRLVNGDLDPQGFYGKGAGGRYRDLLRTDPADNPQFLNRENATLNRGMKPEMQKTWVWHTGEATFKVAQ